jgi:glycoside/pentoside/hexuronide:cation symporter, GPH family
MRTASPADSASPPITQRAYLAFGAGGVAVGTVNTGLNFFLLLYYNQALGLEAWLAGLALAIALFFDAITDPLIGVISDRWRSPRGRRHPFLYASVFPLALTYVAVWYPPAGSDNQYALFAYLLVACMALRLALTLFDVPANALVPELTQDYEERTKLSLYKVSFTWVTSNLTGILMYAIWLKDTSGAGTGLLNVAGYQEAALYLGAAALVATAIVPFGLRRFVPYLASRAPVAHAPVGQVLRNVAQTYSNPSILALLVSAMFLAAASGLTNALWVYLYSYYWGCSSGQVNAIQLTYLCAAVCSLFVLPRIAAGRDKRRLTLTLAAAFWVFTALPYALNSLGVFPHALSEWRMPALMLHAFIDGVLFNMLTSMMFSLLADVVEDSLLKTGRREEGLILASQTFISKTSSALGTWLASTVLVLVAFPQTASGAAVPRDVLWELGATYVIFMWVTGVASALAIARYRITRARYAEIVGAVEAK